MVATIKIKPTDCISFSETQNIIINEKISPTEMEEIVKKSISENNNLDRDELTKKLEEEGYSYNNYYDFVTGYYVFSLSQNYNEPVVMITQKEKGYSTEDFDINSAEIYHSEYHTIDMKVIENEN